MSDKKGLSDISTKLDKIEYRLKQQSLEIKALKQLVDKTAKDAKELVSLMKLLKDLENPSES